MTISHYLKTIGRGARGARALTREQAYDLFSQVLDGAVTDLEIGAFCLAMRIKGETTEEMAGFIGATVARLALVPPSGDSRPTAVLPSYNGARRLPVLTPLLGLSLVERGFRVLVHGPLVESGRTTSAQVLAALGYEPRSGPDQVRDGEINFLPTSRLSAKLSRLLEVRNVVGLRNSAHSVVKLINPTPERALVVSSYTHAAYEATMAETAIMTGADLMLLRGIEGEPVADARRIQQIDTFIRGRRQRVQEGRTDHSADPGWSIDLDPAAIARYVGDVLEGRKPIPEPVALQIQHISDALRAIANGEPLLPTMQPVPSIVPTH